MMVSPMMQCMCAVIHNPAKYTKSFENCCKKSQINDELGIVRPGRPIRLGEFRSALFAFGSWSLWRPGRLGPHGRLVVTFFIIIVVIYLVIL